MYINKLYNKIFLFIILLPFIVLWSCGESGSKADKDLFCYVVLDTASAITKSKLDRYRGQAYSTMKQMQEHLYRNGQILAKRASDYYDSTEEMFKAMEPGNNWARKNLSKDHAKIITKGSKQYKEIMRCLNRIQLK